MTNKRIIHRPIVWAKGRKKSEERKYTTWSGVGDRDYSKLGGLSVSTYEHNDFVGVTAHTSDGRSYGKYFQIPLDNIEEFCHNLIEARNFTRKYKLKSQKSKDE